MLFDVQENAQARERNRLENAWAIENADKPVNHFMFK